ncbi:MAG: bifunctional methylenetetrahydrofolate dehydrogenase/methenyltetrahydrofolate cyclohydrolase FolD [Ruminococcaceae bacterium]|nr:bifunctional methylenetetrahydrofolate dehydrogenase/methenyltetrahydrofolate cyclohydrolase FolD [Oscillospiraceae bacterium]
MAEIIDGKLVSNKLREELKVEVANFKNEFGITPGLAVIMVGDNPASAVYVRNKHKACADVGITSYQIELPTETSEDELLSKIDELNADKNVHGILVQLPLPKHISEEKVINRICADKDVDAFHPINVGKIMIGNYSFLPCTPAGIMELLRYYNVDITGKKCVVVGRSNIVGKPMALLLLEKHGTVTVCHSRTRELSEITKAADILVVAIGKAGFLTADMVKDGAVVIDVGINRLPDGRLSGDVDFEAVAEHASLITPVPGGVGPMTITMLLKNTLTAAKSAAMG